MKDQDPPRGTKRAQILEAAVSLFQERGFHATSMDDISALAQVSKRTLYKYFESKETLFEAILVEINGRISELLAVTYDPARPIEEQLRDLAWAEANLMMSPDFIATCRMLIAEAFRCLLYTSDAADD